MIEIPRAALTADEIATVAEFFSFGTNDLTQTTFGMSRDDAGKFLRLYVEQDVLDYDPFQRLDERGVGRLMKTGVELGRKARPKLKVGICGEHGGEPNSVKFCHKLGLDYVSCSPYRVTVARLAAAQAAIEEKRGKKSKATVKVLLHICCAPCTIYPLKVLRGEGHEVTGFFYNPNIHPYTEFQKTAGGARGIWPGEPPAVDHRRDVRPGDVPQGGP